MERNFQMRNRTKFLPTRVCENRIGRPESIKIASAIRAMSGAATSSRVALPITSIPRLAILSMARIEYRSADGSITAFVGTHLQGSETLLVRQYVIHEQNNAAAAQYSGNNRNE